MLLITEISILLSDKLHVAVSNLLYRVIHNSVKHFTKSVHLNGEYDFNLRPTYKKETLHVYFYLPRALSLVGCRQGSRLNKNGANESENTTTEDQALLHWPQGSPDLKPCDFFLWVYVKDYFYRLYHRMCLSCLVINRS